MYAPYTSGATTLSAINFTVTSDQSAKSAYLASDFVHGWNKGTPSYDAGTFTTTYLGIPYNNDGSAVSVGLVHDLSKIILNIQAGSGASIAASAVNAVTLGDNDIYTSATIDITQGAYDVSSTEVKATANATTKTDDSDPKATITFADNSTSLASVAAIIPPQTVTDKTLNVTIGSTIYTATLSSPFGGFLAGKIGRAHV